MANLHLSLRVYAIPPGSHLSSRLWESGHGRLSHAATSKEKGEYLCPGMGGRNLAVGCSRHGPKQWVSLHAGTSTVLWTELCLVSLQWVWWVWVYDCTWLWSWGLETSGQNPSPGNKVQQSEEPGSSGEAPSWQVEQCWRAESLCRAKKPDPKWHSSGASATGLEVDCKPALQPSAWPLPAAVTAEQEHWAPCLPADWARLAPHADQQQTFFFSHLPAHP